MVIWITGISGTGKTTIAAEVVAKLRKRQQAVVHLDGNELREAIRDDAMGPDRESRLAHAYRVCRLARLFESQSLWVVVSTVSLYHEVHEWNRANFDRYFEVLVKASDAEIGRRPTRGASRRYLDDEVENLVGFETPIEYPHQPHLVVENETHDDTLALIPNLAQRVLDAAFGADPRVQTAH